MKKLYLSKTQLKKAGKVNTYPSSHPPGSAPSHKLQKPSKASGIFQSLGTICSSLIKDKVKKGGGMAQYPPKYAPGAMSLVNDHIKTTAEDALRVCIVG